MLDSYLPTKCLRQHHGQRLSVSPQLHQPRWLRGRESTCQADVGSIPGSGKVPGEGNDNPVQHSCLGNPTDRGAWQATAQGIAKELDTT